MKSRLLLTYPAASTFVRDDIALLSEQYDVRTFGWELGSHAGPGQRLQILNRWVAQRAWLREEMAHAHLVLSWFADFHAVLPVRAARAHGVPSAVIIGGFDANWLPELGYGVYESRWRAPLARYVLRHTDLLLPVSGTLIEASNRFATWPDLRRQGVRVHTPGLNTPHSVVPTGYDPEAWPMGAAERGRTVCTVGYISSARSAQIKGLDLVAAAAHRMPDTTFVVVGVPEDKQEVLRRMYSVPSNVTLVEPLPRNQLVNVYQSASVYLQLSRSEGLPNVLCEAMLCGCIPVGSAVGGIPDAIGEKGEIVESSQTDEIVAAIERGITRAPHGRPEARQRIATHFSRAKRRHALFAALRGLIDVK